MQRLATGIRENGDYRIRSRHLHQLEGRIKDIEKRGWKLHKKGKCEGMPGWYAIFRRKDNGTKTNDNE